MSDNVLPFIRPGVKPVEIKNVAIIDHREPPEYRAQVPALDYMPSDYVAPMDDPA
jgi:hypothetical protein